MPTKTIKVRGALGCGKTEWLAEKTVQLMKENNPSTVVYLAYTRGARQAIQERLHKKLDLPCVHTEKKPKCKHLPYVGTIHSICFELSGCTQNNIITPSKKHQFEAIAPLVYDSELDEKRNEELSETTVNLRDKPRGNAALAIISACRHKKISLSHWQDVVTPEDRYQLHFDVSTLELFRGAYEKWKRNEGLLDYEDILETTIETKRAPLTLKHLLVDEFQDLYPLLYDVYAMWRDATPAEVYFAGDEHQTIYKYAGADERTFLNEPHTELIQLNVNYRCPSTIWQFAKKIIHPFQLYDVNAITAKNQGGEIAFHNGIDWNELLPRKEDASTLYLTRTNKEANAIHKQLVMMGIPARFTTIDGTLSEDFVDGFNALAKTHPSNSIKPNLKFKEVQSVVSYTPSKEFLVHGIKKKFEQEIDVKTDDWTVKEFYGVFKPLKRPVQPYAYEEWVKNLKISELQQAFIKNRKFIQIEQLNVHTGTNHSGKGRTSDRVVIFNQMPGIVKRHWPNGEREERYLYHMAVGRAAKKLDIVNMADSYPFLARL